MNLQILNCYWRSSSGYYSITIAFMCRSKESKSDTEVRDTCSAQTPMQVQRAMKGKTSRSM